MKQLVVPTAALGVLLVAMGQDAGQDTASERVRSDRAWTRSADLPWDRTVAHADPAAEGTEVVQRVCARCHNDRRLVGNLSLEGFDVAAADQAPDVAERMVRKLRAGMMPPPGVRRPAGDTLLSLVETLEGVLDAAAAERPNPGVRTFQRLNRPEYERAIQDLLGLSVDAGA